MKAILSFLEKLTLSPDAVSGTDIQELIDLGLSRQAIMDAVQVCVTFNIIDRIADTLNFAIPADEVFARMAGPLLKMGYRI